jgi:hypothetical protein
MKRFFTLVLLMIVALGVTVSQNQTTIAPKAKVEKKVTAVKDATKSAKAVSPAKTTKAKTKAKVVKAPKAAVPAVKHVVEPQPAAAPAVAPPPPVSPVNPVNFEGTVQQVKENAKTKVENVKSEVKGKINSLQENAIKKLDTVKTKF